MGNKIEIIDDSEGVIVEFVDPNVNVYHIACVAYEMVSQHPRDTFLRKVVFGICEWLLRLYIGQITQ